MNCRVALLTLAVLVSLALPCLAADSYRVQLSCPAQVSVPAPSGSDHAVYIRDALGQWGPADFTVKNGRLTLSLDPAVLSGGRALVLVNPPADMDIRDAVSPRLLRLRVDRDFAPVDGQVSLGNSSDWPRRLMLEVTDDGNALDGSSLKLSLDGEPLRRRVRVEQVGPRSLWVRAKLPKPEYGEHAIAYSIRDASPQANRLEGRIVFGRYDLTNYVLAMHGVKLTADSNFVGYPSLACLNDGDTVLSGSSLPNSASWASIESDTPHWVEVDLGRTRTVKEVTVFWANYTDRINTSKQIEIQVPDGDGWKAVYRSPADGESPAASTTFEFEPIELSRFRVWQPSGGGGEERPSLMWLAEIEAR